MAGLQTLLLLIAATACGSSSDDNAAGGSDIAATATPGDEFCSLVDVARTVGHAVAPSETDPVRLKANVVAATEASRAAVAAAPADYREIAAATIAQQEALVALLEKYDYSFVEVLASDDGNAFFADPGLAEVKAERDAYLQEHCNLAPSDNSSAGGAITLSPGDEGIRQLFQLLRLGGEVEISDDQIDCAVGSLSGAISDTDLQAIGAGTTVSDAGTQAFVLAIANCGITLPES